ncbi:MAG: HEAT repeat domain-containing protein [Planctomycetia bacterium]|nr:HEAT repeat domain-containing protein [Planctomycetia bacterium]
MKQVIRSLAALVVLSSVGAGWCRAEVFLLENDGQIRGELVNRDESPRKTYVIKTATGGQVTLDAAQVKKVVRQSAAEVKYDRIRPDYPDTVEGQWQLAEWCRENRLNHQRAAHLERILELDPNHAGARHALGYSQINGRWLTQQQKMTENGYVKHNGSWVLPQEVEIMEQQRKEKLAQLEWASKLKRWQGWLNTNKAEQAQANIQAIDDPFAARPLAKYLDQETRRDVRMLYVGALGRLNVPAGLDALVHASLFDGDEEVRMACLDQVVSHQYKPAVGTYINSLKSKDNRVVNRAAVCLGQMKDSSAIGPLINALRTVHTFQIQKGQPGNMGATFGTGPNSGSFSFGGGGVQIVKQTFDNRDVLQALVDLTGGVSYNFDVSAWKYWFAAQKKPTSLDARRDDQSK